MKYSHVICNKPVQDMDTIELATNSCYAKDGEAWYRNYDEDVTARDYARRIVKEFDRGKYKDSVDESFFTDDEEFDETMFDWCSYDVDCFQGFVALFYRNLWAMAEVYEELKDALNKDLKEGEAKMDKPCKHCGKAVNALRGEAFEQECFGTCDAYDRWADATHKALNELLKHGVEILERHGES
ncbi:MAG: hypothetical protein PHV18_11080 [Lachnospiraceae bacterium]|nr:hypothetical protein [Lachnospiraceae bacterium]